MKKISILLLILSSFNTIAQLAGDTIVVKAFKYGSNTRDTLLQFPNSNLSFEKIILKYNMRCKNALISNNSNPNQGCGEWDYSCNTFLVDSTKIENEPNTRSKYDISNFSGNTFSYTSLPLYDFYNYSLTPVTVNSIISENQYTLGTGNLATPNLLKSDEKSGKSQILYTAAELIAAGFSAGNINGILLNVLNNGGTVNFLKIGIQQSAQTALNSNSVSLSGFTTVYNSNFSFINGNNRVQFFTPFIWNGTSNLLIEFSFTNTNPSNPVILNGMLTPSITCLYARNNYALDVSAFGHVIINPALLTSINNELTVSFWAHGTASLLPANTSVIYGYGSNVNQRNLNIHLPWSDSNIYFDCGFSNGNFDRINSAATASVIGGQWNHWAFTKNSVTGTMKIYLNGALWASGSALTKPITLLNLILGKDQDLLNNYKGKLNELTIWNKELNLTDIQTWMNKPIDVTHPFYTNLLAYYKMNEGNGLTILDSKNNLSSNGSNLQWKYDRGNNLNKLFYQTSTRPNLVFLRGSYALTTTSISVKDSVLRNPNVVQEYSVVSNATVIPMTNDLINLASTTTLYEALPQNIYNGDTGILTGSIAVTPQGVITNTILNYFKRYPFYNELLSFVTPYGKGLDLGAKGKTWYYDVSDFAPLLKGSKRFLMALGGQNQEQMDIDFWFIVGTPPRNVIQFNQLWQGAARNGGASISSINNDTRFNSLTVPIPNLGVSFKMRSTITGHGSQGEFGQNGGVVSHYFNINGGANEFSWPITQICSTNPIIAQGGTWIYNRQGWCPGQTSLMKEYNITQFVSPGSSISLDYNCSNPTVANGDYRYIAAHQLVSYGNANFSNDASIIDVLSPSNKVLYSKTNPMCANPVILVKNTGSNVITELDIDYWNNNASSKESYHWSGNLNFMDTALISLPIGNLWQNGVLPSNNYFHVELKKVNALIDQYIHNNFYHTAFVLSDVISRSIVVEFKTNNNPFESTYRIVDDNGNGVSGNSNLIAANTIYSDSYLLDGCFKLIVEDAGGDGLQWWANTAQGSGYVKIKNALGAVLKSFPTDFGSRFEYSFTTFPYDFVSLNNTNFEQSIFVFPNPTRDNFQITGNNIQLSEINITDLLGRFFELPNVKNKDSINFDTSNLNPGVYLISIFKDSKKIIKKLVIY